jgi:SagB-type dehydrogenase family enzyme
MIIPDKSSPLDAERDELTRLIDELDGEERGVILDMLKRARQHGSARLDTLALIHSSMLSTRADAGAIGYDELSTMKSPPVQRPYEGRARVRLPQEVLPIEHSLSAVIAARSSRRDYTHQELSLAQVSTLLNLSYGVKKHILAYNTRDFPVRQSPSQGGLQCIELYAVVNRVEGVEKGLYAYYADDPSLIPISLGNYSQAITSACIFQDYVQHAAIVLILAVDMDRIEWKYHARGYRFAHADAGVLAAHIYLVATGLRLRTTAIAAFYDNDVNALIRADGRNEFAALVMPVGARPDWGSDG